MKNEHPRVKFEVAKFSHVINPLIYFLNPKEGDWNWSGIILNRYPALRKNLDNLDDFEERKRTISGFFKSLMKENRKDFEDKVEVFQGEWNRVSESYMNALEEVLEFKWPEKDKIITAFIGPNPICPRNITQRTFDICYQFDLDKLKALSFHEILHFAYFEKWKQVFPETNKGEFDRPHLVWHLSEMVPGIILNDERFQEIFKHRHNVYKVYCDLKINGKFLLGYLREFYESRENFEDFLRKSWDFVNKHNGEILAAK